MLLSRRLKAVADFVPQDMICADIGSDHGYLPIYLVGERIIPHAIAADIGKGPLESAAANVRKYDLADKIELRLGNGLTVLRSNEVECVTICGMGGSLMSEILDNSPEVVDALKCMVLEPNVGAHLIRRWAGENHWQITAEELIEEDGHFYPIIRLEKGEMAELSAAEEFAGPLLLEAEHPLLGDYLNYWRHKELKLAMQLLAVGQAETDEKAQALQKKWSAIEEEYQCHFHSKL